MSKQHPHTAGRGMTSQRSRDRLADQLKRKGIDDPRVLEAIRKVPRHRFMDEALSYKAYDDTALPIGKGQTISQPFVVARMTALLLGDPEQTPPRRVLEVGTGSGYQCAVLAEVVETVYSVERIPELYKQARRRVRELGYQNARIRLVDGTEGLPDYGPFDGILVTAAGPRVPEPLKRQLAVGGRMVIPVGAPGLQYLTVIERLDEEHYDEKRLDAVSFVPLVSGPG